MDYGMGNKYGLDLESLWDMLKAHENIPVNDVEEINLSNGNWLRHTMEDGHDFYDLFNREDVIVCMDGELCEILEENNEFFELIEEDTQVRFKLSRREFEIAVMC